MDKIEREFRKMRKLILDEVDMYVERMTVIKYEEVKI